MASIKIRSHGDIKLQIQKTFDIKSNFLSILLFKRDYFQ